MATTYPSDIWTRFKAAKDELTLGQIAEFETLRLLEERLPGNLFIYFSINWAFMDGRRMHSREVDFVIANRRGECLFIEQKMGQLEESDRGLSKYYGGKEKNVVEQILDSLDGLKSNFRNANPDARPLHLSYLLYCPDYRVADRNAAGLDPNSIIDAVERGALATVIQSRLGGGGADWTEQGERLHAFLKREFKLTPDLGRTLDLQETRFTQLTEGVVDVLSCLEAEPLRLYIAGVAGCGKSLIARHYYEDALDRGKDPLLICFNTQLRDQFRSILPEGGTVDTFLGFLKAFSDRPDIDIDFDPQSTDPDKWNRLRDEVSSSVGDADATFDRLIVDEGQDLTSEAYESLRLFLKEGADVVWMEDTDQDLGQSDATGGPFKPDGFWRLTLTRNYRTPLKIAQFIRATLPFEFEPANALPGYAPRVAAYRDDEEQREQVEVRIRDLLDDGFAPTDITVVTMRGLTSSPLYQSDELGGITVRRFTGEYADGLPVFTDGDLLFDSIRRFKGLQSPAVLLVDVDPNPERETDIRALYCGMSRATVRLEMFAKRDNAFNKAKLF